MKIRLVIFVSIALLEIFISSKAYSQNIKKCDSLKDGPPRGIMCLHCLDANNQKSAYALTEALINSCYKKVGLSFVIDGSFGTNFQTISDSMNRIIDTSEGRQPFLHLYMISGPAQRRWAQNIFSGFGINFSPRKFRQLISKDENYKNEYKDYISLILPIISELYNKGVKISITPVLEDNLNLESFRSILSLTKDVFRDFDIKYYRNPCPDCYYGNDRTAPKGTFSELHHIGKYLKTRNGLVSNDGWGYVFFDKEKKVVIKKPYKITGRVETAFYLKELVPFLKVASKGNNTFMLWLSKFQVTLPENKSLAPENRRYPIPTDSEIEQLAKFIAS